MGSAVPSLPTDLESFGAAVDGQKPGLEDSNISNGVNGHDSDSDFKLHDTPIENFRPIKVIVIGAGFSGICCGIRIPERIRNVDLVIYDKNEGIGGTWWENRYPGCACDIPSHSYQFSFSPNTQWSALYAPSSEIQAYLENTAKKYSADRYIKLSHRIDSCTWSAAEGRWHVSITNLKTGQTFTDSSDILINARGGLNDINWPTIPGLDTFKGEVMHSASWNQRYDFANKRIGIIGSGSSSIQIVPQLQRLPGTELSVFVRNRTWISPSFGQELWDHLGFSSFAVPSHLREEFARDPAAYAKFRLQVEEGGNGIHGFTMKGTPLQKGARAMFEGSMKERLKAKPEIFETLVPGFAPGCRRLTPGPGYLEALCKDNVDFVTEAIKGIEEEGVRTQDGKVHELDALVCATGFKTSAPPPFPMMGSGGVEIAEHWQRYPRSYMGILTDGFPNMFMMLGPNAGIGSGSLTMMIEANCGYVVKCIRKMQKENYKSMSVKSQRVDEFGKYAQAYFEGTVFKDKCRSWYKNQHEEITGLWPGSTQHYIESCRSPRWEDMEYESLEGEEYDNGMAWLGNGWSDNQLKGKHLAWYLYPEYLEIPTAPRPEENDLYEARPFSH